MSERRVLLDAAAFLDSAPALRLDVATTDDIRVITQRFLQVCYGEIGKAPRLLDGEELRNALCELLPRHFGAKDPLAPAVPAVLHAYLQFLDETQVVANRFELQQAFDAHSTAFVEAVNSGIVHARGVAVTEKAEPFVHRASKTGRNDPCPCGSGKKLKKCCGRGM